MSEVLFLVLMIFMCFTTIVSMIGAAVATYIAWRSVVAFLASEAQKEEYTRFLRVMLDKIEEDSEIFRLEMVRRIGADIPEMKKLNSLLIQLENSMRVFKETMKDFISEG